MSKATFKTKPLSELFSSLTAVIPSRSPKIAIQNAHVEFGNGRASLSGTNLEQFVSLGIECESDGSGTQMWRADKVAAILKACQGDTVSFESKKTCILIRCGKAKWEIPTAAAEEFPKASDIQVEGELIEVATDPFKTMLKRVGLAADVDGTQKNQAMTNVQLSTRDGGICLAATDSKRAAHVTLPASFTTDFKCLLPISAIKHIDRAIPPAGKMKLRIGENNAEFIGDGARVLTRLAHGGLPDIAGRLPKITDDAKFLLPASSLMRAIQQVSLAGSEHSVGVDMTLESGNMVLEAKSAENGEASTEMPLSYDLPAANLRFDPSFLLEVLRAVGDVTITAMFHKQVGEQHRGAPRYERILLDVGDFHYFIVGMATPQNQAASPSKKPEPAAA